VQLRWPEEIGANRPGLRRYQAAFLAGDDLSSTPGVRFEPGFRPINLTLDDFESANAPHSPWPDDLTVLYWWRSTFWRKHLGGEGV